MRFRIAVLAAGLGVVALMTGCDPKPTAGLQSAPEPLAPGNSVTGTAAPTTAPADEASAPAPAADATSAASSTGCPVTADTLLTALRNDTGDMYRRAGSPAALVEATCYEGYAVARTASDGRHDRVSVVFKYDTAATAWHPINLGSADFCAGVPAAVAPHLPGCE
jgi:hypothetical protein